MDLLEPQSRGAEIAAGIAALAAGFGGLTICTILYIRDPDFWGVYLGAAVVSIYALVLAWRLIGPRRNRRYLVSPVMLFVLGFSFIGVAAVTWIVLGESLFTAISPLGIGIAAIVLAWRRLRGEDTD